MSRISVVSGLLLLMAGCQSSPEYAQSIEFETGSTYFLGGDRIVIEEIQGDGTRFVPGTRFVVSGTYILASRDAATLQQWCANGEVRVHGERSRLVRRGKGRFRFEVELVKQGYLHLSMYPTGGGTSFCSLYYGQEEWVWRGGFSKPGPRPKQPGIDFENLNMLPPMTGHVVNADNKLRLVQVDVGRSKGMVRGAVLDIVRGDTYIGRMRIDTVFDDASAGLVTILADGYTVKPGDRVTNTLK